MAFAVRSLFDRKPPAVTASPEEPASIAVNRMIVHDYSQLPVVTGDARVVGMVSHESVLRAMVTFACGIEKLSVRDAMFRHRAVSLDAGMAELLDGLGQCASLLALDRAGELIGIVTDFDMTAYFRADVEDRMHVADIELAVRGFVSGSYGGDATLELRHAVRRSSSKELRAAFNKALRDYLGVGVTVEGGKVNQAFEDNFIKDKPFDQLTLNEFIGLFTDQARWGTHFATPFGDKREEVRGLLEKVRDARNAIAHLRGLNSEQRELLRFCAEWLGRIQEAQEQRAPVAAVEVIPDAPATTEPVVIPATPEAPPSPPVDAVTQNEGGYASLSAYLQGIEPSRAEVVIAFADVERIIGAELPDSARRHRAWWANDSEGHVQAQSWLDVGWKAAVNLSAGQVRFTRTAGREDEYIHFFSSFLTQLRAAGMSAAPSPHGGSFHWIVGMHAGTTRVGWLAVSFGRGGRFRSELYLDGGEREANKRVFDSLIAQREQIEQTLGAPLTWERLDDQRASRIARYRPGKVTDEAVELAELQRLAVEDVVALHAALGEALRAIARRAEEARGASAGQVPTAGPSHAPS